MDPTRFGYLYFLRVCARLRLFPPVFLSSQSHSSAFLPQLLIYAPAPVRGHHTPRADWETALYEISLWHLRGRLRDGDNECSYDGGVHATYQVPSKSYQVQQEICSTVVAAVFLL